MYISYFFLISNITISTISVSDSIKFSQNKTGWKKYETYGSLIEAYFLKFYIKFCLISNIQHTFVE